MIAAIGKEATDRDLLEAMAMMSSTTNQKDAAAAFLKADQLLTPSGAHQDAIKAVFKNTGY